MFNFFLFLTEKGDFLALDLGGTNFRVILLTLDPASELQSIVKYYKVPEEVRLGEGVEVSIFIKINFSLYRFISSIIYK